MLYSQEADLTISGVSPRRCETPSHWARSERVYLKQADCWFFRTREGIDVGPYGSRFEAEVEAGLWQALLEGARSEDARKAAIREFVMESHAMGRSLCVNFPRDEQSGRAAGA